MNAVELIQYALGNAIGILNQVVSDLTQEQADWRPPGIANPIGATYWHTVSSVDEIVHAWLGGGAPLKQKNGWQEKVLTTSVPQPGEGGETLAYMQAIRVDLASLHAYAEAVSEAVQGWLASLTPEELERKLQTPIGELSVVQVLETFIIWHINAHCGEIAALKGCQGVKGYPF
jgi:hypothetical protein